MSKAYDYLVFIGRFQPFHRAHQGVIAQALALADNVILLLGSADSPRTVSNPWTVAEREAMIRSTYSEEDNQRIFIRGIVDHPHDDVAWQRNVVRTVNEISGPDRAIGLIGHMKDSSSYYLGLFPDWAMVSVDNIDQINATDLRKQLFSLPDSQTFHHPDLHPAINQTLEAFRHSEDFSRLQAEYAHLQAHKEAWTNAPFPPIFVTVDALVLCQQCVLMVQRKGPLGAGLWALPGGFVEKEETLADGARRELYEETGLALEQDALAVSVFDRPDRSARGRTITHVHSYSLDDDVCPEVQAADDAAEARWIPLAELKRSQCFEDHYSIIQAMT
ncbi:bifunctional nicotinamide-nucleotide adenylyltransferase/Nudix hydroxylase [Suttonella sp. R2A3]|uniref:bifunctional nicotinamide-nucleotide adenylyltransferase/Nudix hydroxylase n=1 Tax=Suttonella sp. R2A3 TaxID=2908648 RepID=UPI001F4593D4|nr:bifunctional nicotinamide-nucleotide adenylyltransferase/Nudix hydroxylase [Suttonella sp. R2A3]UJF25020.1 bifunctional nicotinamide-nucleotide adenylyltransferase/Nudix hydroxylase [Suttonella sp. R2A3]